MDITPTCYAQRPDPGRACRVETMLETWLCVSKALPPGGVETLAKVAEQPPPEQAQTQTAG